MQTKALKFLTFGKQAISITLAMAMIAVAPAAQAGFLKKLAIASAIGYAVHAHSKANRHAQQDSGAGAEVPASTGQASCTSQFAFGKAPTFDSPKVAQGLQTICYSEFTVAVSSKTRSPLWSAEYLTSARIQAARHVQRVNAFHPEPSQGSEGAMLEDFLRSGYHRGHLSPSADMSNPQAQYESFTLANMIAQDPQNNMHLWESIEAGTRNYAIQHERVYVITGPLFKGQSIKFINNRVAVPTQIFKLLYDPATKAGGVYLVDNIDTQDIAWKSIPEFEAYSGIHFGLGATAMMPMPKPIKHS